jgi:hypothetical protein
MTPVTKLHPKRKGAVLIVAMIFVLIFAALAVSMAAMSGTNVQIASNQHKADYALGSATSGLEVERYWLKTVMMPNTTPESKYLSTIYNIMQSNMDANGISNITLKHTASIVSILPVTLDSAIGQTFNGQMNIDTGNPNILQVLSTGGNAPITRTIKVDFDIEPYEWPIFNYGMATKGPINYTGNPTTLVASEAWEADIYVESSGSGTALSVAGNTKFMGDIEIGNPAANVSFGADVIINGDHGQDAIDNHVTIGAEPVAFPEPDTARFTTYATGDVIDSSTDLNTYTNILTNCKIAAGTNPIFPKSVTIRGILLIESPNIVTFSQNVALEGIIVGQGDCTVDPATDRIDFLGNFASGPYPADAEFDAIRAEEGSSIVAPGFAASFQGNFSTLEGVVALSGVTFSGNVNAMIKGTIINYSEQPMVIMGNASMTFDRAASTKIPAGFDTLRVLTYIPSSYDEFTL